MTVEQIIESAKQLSDSEKLLLVEGVVRMLRKSIVASQAAVNENGVQSVAEAAAPYVADRLILAKSDTDLDFDSVLDEDLDALLQAHLTSPDPEPHQMLPYGLFKGVNFTEEDFLAAEWHPSAEDFASA
ncbi:MAG: hypothetical protein HY328_12585 [Chloroflexi bacterium]|nr:hypothetical protein [Chloroflexota bacterium]